MPKTIKKPTAFLKPITFGKLAVSINGKIFHIASLSFHELKKEFFYHFTLDRSEGSNKLEHVSFHADGKIHLKLRDSSNKIEYKNRIGGNPNLFEFKRDSYIPLLVNSFYFDDPNAADVFPILTKADNVFVWDIGAGKNFSLVPIIVGSEVSPENITQGFEFLIDKSQSQRFLREPLKRFSSHKELNQPPSSSSLCILFSDAVIPQNKSATPLIPALPEGYSAASAIAAFSLHIAPSIPELNNLCRPT